MLLDLLRKVLRPASVLDGREEARSSSYQAFSIGPEEFAIGARELDAQNDEEALEKATPLLHNGLKWVEVWFGSRKVGKISAKPDA
jgi:hypothetical protein